VLPNDIEATQRGLPRNELIRVPGLEQNVKPTQRGRHGGSVLKNENAKEKHSANEHASDGNNVNVNQRKKKRKKQSGSASFVALTLLIDRQGRQ
jgi:hypothetical protein